MIVQGVVVSVVNEDFLWDPSETRELELFESFIKKFNMIRRYLGSFGLSYAKDMTILHTHNDLNDKIFLKKLFGLQKTY